MSALNRTSGNDHYIDDRLKGYGYIQYDPQRYSMKRNTKWWCVLKINHDLSRYYRYWTWKKYGLELEKPAWDCHISILRGEKPKNDLMHLWKKYDGKKVEFFYSNVVYPCNQGKHFAIKAHSNDLMFIRKELGLPCNYDLHITIGKTYEPLDKFSMMRIYNE